MAGPRTFSLTGGGSVLSTRGGVSVSASIRGGAELIRKLEQLDRGLRDEMLVQATAAAAEVIADEWRARVPVLDADYRSSITVVASPGKKGATALVFTETVAGLEDSQQPRNYAPRLEFGSSRASRRQFKRGILSEGRVRGAQPSLRPAFDAAQGRAVDAMSDELRSLIEGAV